MSDNSEDIFFVKPIKYAKRLGSHMVRDRVEHDARAVCQSEDEAQTLADQLNTEKKQKKERPESRSLIWLGLKPYIRLETIKRR